MIYRELFFILFPFLLFQSFVSLCVPSSKQCGCSQIKPVFSESKIVGGYTARDNSWPWMVSLRRTTVGASTTSSGSAFCAGSLISDKYVLTAAHCFYNVKLSEISNYFVVVAAVYKNDTNPVRFTIKSFILHDQYNDQSKENDIALLELTYRVDLDNPKIGFICLPPSNIPTYPYEQMNATAIGWGRLEQGDSSSYTLQQVQLPVIPYTNEYCYAVVDNDLVQFCAGLIQGGKDTCQGDSGGPLMIYDSTSTTWNIAGITSYGYGCALPESPGVYTRVSMFVNWINGHINLQSQASTIQTTNGIFLFSLYINLFF